MKLETIDGDEVDVDLPSEREVMNAFKMAVTELVTEKNEEVTEDNLHVRDAQKIFEKVTKDIQFQDQESVLMEFNDPDVPEHLWRIGKQLGQLNKNLEEMQDD